MNCDIFNIVRQAQSCFAFDRSAEKEPLLDAPETKKDEELLLNTIKNIKQELSNKPEIVRAYYPGTNQLKYEYQMKNGEKQGEYRSWYITGGLRVQCNYETGVKHGLYHFWTQFGNKILDIDYCLGAPVEIIHSRNT